MERPWYHSVDWLLAATCVAISLLGVLMIRSADLHDPGAGSEWTKQLAYVAVGVGLLAIFAAIPYQKWQRWARLLYVVNFLLLAGVLAAGHASHGAVRWISLGPLGTFQPSEPAKLILGITGASLLARAKTVGPREMLLTIVAVMVPALLILKQPDFGTMLVVFAIVTCQLFFAVEKMRHFAVYAVLTTAVAAFTLGTKFVLKPFQRDRLLVFLHPNRDLEGIGYNLHQSKIAIGSGELFGKGLFKGTQTQLQFVPEHSRDFIFTVLGEEFGYIGAVSLVVLYGVVLARAMRAVLSARDRFGLLLGAGIAAMLAVHIVVNVGMTIGIMPVTGIPLPFMSYGGSAILTDFIAIGILLNISYQHDQLVFV